MKIKRPKFNCDIMDDDRGKDKHVEGEMGHAYSKEF